MNYFSLILGRWREILIAILLAAIFVLHTNNKVLEANLDSSKVQLSTCMESKTKSEGKVDVYEKSSADADVAYRHAEEKRLDVIATLANSVNTMRAQQIPKDCQAAIDWSILHKGDLSWPK